jgi:transcriptional regulator with XRE-family HTH domain
MLNISKIESLIKERGWTKTYFCGLFGHSRTWIDDWKRGKGIPKETTLVEVANALGTTFGYITDQTEQKNKPPMSLDDLTPYELDLIMKLREGPEEVTDAVYRAVGIDPERK